MSDAYNHLSQLAPLPPMKNLILGKTIGHGGFAMVKMAKPKNGNGNPNYVALKLIYLPFAEERGVSKQDIAREAFIQKNVEHQNIIRLFDFKLDSHWAWIALELAENGELFDKIEPDLGVDSDVAHFYFTQLINAVEFIHGKGVAHRDIKPENLVLDSRGNLKLTDFGLACVFKKRTGPKKLQSKPCGSPPYSAPEIVTGSYDPSLVDIWSCGIVLFVLLTGKIAWEQPTYADSDFKYFLEHKGEILTFPWNKIELGALGLLRKILVVDVNERITIPKIKQSKWMLKERGLLDSKGMCKDPHKLHARLLVNLYINLSDGEFKKVTEYSATQRSGSKRNLETQPLVTNIVDDLDLGDNNLYSDVYSHSQQPYTENTKRRKLKNSLEFKHQRELELISMDPATIQFYRQENGVSLESRQKLLDQEITKRMTQMQKHPELFADSFTRFFSFASLESILSLLNEALEQLNIIDSDNDVESQRMRRLLDESKIYHRAIRFQIDFIDDYNNKLSGEIVLSKVADNLEAKKIDFIRIGGDPLEWRRLFKRVTILCRDIVYYPEH